MHRGGSRLFLFVQKRLASPAAAVTISCRPTGIVGAEWVPIVLIIVPILLPLIDELGFNLTWFGILVAVNLQTAWLSPPVALSAYFLKGVVPEWDLKDIYVGMMQFMVLQVIGLLLIIFFPRIALRQPGVIYGK